MNAIDYPAFCRAIWCGPHNEHSLAVAGLGIIGEAGEVLEVATDRGLRASLRDECGDVLYYLTILADWKGLSLMDIDAVRPMYSTRAFGTIEASVRLVVATKEVSERVKKYIRDGADPSKDEWRELLGTVLDRLATVLLTGGMVLGHALDANVTKLSARYCVKHGGRRPCEECG